MPFTKIDPQTPAGTEKKKFGDDRIREFKEQTIANFQAVTNYPATEVPALRTAVWTTATRPAGDELVNRVTGYNTDLQTEEYWDVAGAKWQQIGSGRTIAVRYFWQPETECNIGDIVFTMQTGGNFKRMECVAAGTTGITEPTWPAVGQYVIDGSVRWVVDDIRDGQLPGDIRFPAMFVRAGEIKMTGQLENRADVPRLVKLATDNNLIVSETAWAGGMCGLFGEGDGSTTIRMPDLRGEFIRVWDDGRGVDAGRAFGSTQGDAIRDFQWGFSAHTGNASLLSPVAGVPNALETTRANMSQSGSGSGHYQNGARWRVGAAVPVAPENRPRNIALLACIKY